MKQTHEVARKLVNSFVVERCLQVGYAITHFLMPTTSDWRNALKRKPDDTIIKITDFWALRIHIDEKQHLAIGLPVQQGFILGPAKNSPTTHPEESAHESETNESDSPLFMAHWKTLTRVRAGQNETATHTQHNFHLINVFQWITNSFQKKKKLFASFCRAHCYRRFKQIVENLRRCFDDWEHYSWCLHSIHRIDFCVRRIDIFIFFADQNWMNQFLTTTTTRSRCFRFFFRMKKTCQKSLGMFRFCHKKRKLTFSQRRIDGCGMVALRWLWFSALRSLCAWRTPFGALCLAGLSRHT